MKKKDIIFVLISIIILIVIGVVSLVPEFLTDTDLEEAEPVDSENISIDFMSNMDIEEYEGDGFVVKGAKINNGYFEGFFISKNEEKIESLRLEITFFDSSKKEIKKLYYVFEDVSIDEERDLFCILDFDYSNAYFIEAKIVN